MAYVTGSRIRKAQHLILAGQSTLAQIALIVGFADQSHALALPIVQGITLASLQNRFSADITVFLNNFTADAIGVTAAGATLGLIRAITLRDATQRLLRENDNSLVTLASGTGSDKIIIDQMAHRASMAFVRAPGLKHAHDKIVTRVLLDLQAARALAQIKTMLPALSAEMQQALRIIQEKSWLILPAARALPNRPQRYATTCVY